MDASEDELRQFAREEIRKFWIGLGLIILATLSALDTGLLYFIVPKFQQIFADALPGKPLPPVTLFIIRFRIELLFVALGWPIIGTILWRRKSPYAFPWVNLGMIWILLGIAITVAAMFMPMVSIDGGMSDAGK